MKTSRKIAPSFSLEERDKILKFASGTFVERTGILDIQVPRSWDEMSEELKRKVFVWISHFDIMEVKLKLFKEVSGIHFERVMPDGTYPCWVRVGIFRKIRFRMQLEEILEHLAVFDFICETTVGIPRLAVIAGRQAVDGMLHDVPFEVYLICENLYQGYLYTKNEGQLREMYELLYGPARRRYWQKKPNTSELVSIFFWWAAVKQQFAQLFPDFFRPVNTAELGEQPSLQRMMEVMNAQIRALTGGDITKEAQVLGMDTWRALTELNAKAADVASLKSLHKLT